jgi:hypothetical protein
MNEINRVNDTAASRGTHIVWRLALLPFRLVFRTAFLAFRAGLRVGSMPIRITAAASRRLGVVGTLSLIAGVTIGLLLAPVPGRQLRQQLRTLAARRPPMPDPELWSAVVSELAAAQRTWHLPQPEVVVSAGVVTLTGAVPHDTGRIELEAVAVSVPGVHDVINRLVVT